MTGDDGLKTTVGACGLSSLAVSLSHTLFRPENFAFCVVNARMGRHFMQLTGVPRFDEGVEDRHRHGAHREYGCSTRRWL